MAIASEQTLSGSTTDGSDVVLSSWTPGSDELVLVGVVTRLSALAAVTVTGNGISFTEVARLLTAGSPVSHQISLYRGHASSPTTGSITASVSGATQTNIAIATRFSGVDVATTDGVEASGSTQGASPPLGSSDMLLSLTTVTDGAWLVGMGGVGGSATFTVPSGETAINTEVRAGTGNSERSAHMWYESVATAANTQLGSTGDLSSSTLWNLILVSLKPSSGGTTTTKSLTGSVSFVGSSLILATLPVSGVVSFSGLVGSAVFKFVSSVGAVSFSGGLSRKLARIFTGAVSFVGSMKLLLRWVYFGGLTFSGGLSSQFVIQKLLSGSVSFAGSVVTSASLFHAGVLSFSGSLSRKLSKGLSGSLSQVGEILRSNKLTVLGVLSLVGVLTKGFLYTIALVGVVSFSGALSATLGQALVWFADLIESDHSNRSDES